MVLFIPHNLNIEELINNNPPKFRPFKKDSLLYILNLITVIPSFNDEFTVKQYIPLNAQKLQKFIKNYKRYLEYLIDDLDIIESDKHYVNGNKSKGYRFTKNFRTKVKAVSLNDSVLSRAFKKDKKVKVKSVKKYKYLTKWYNESLQIDYDVVRKFIDAEYNLKYNDTSLWDRHIKQNKIVYKSPLVQYNHALIAIEKLKFQDFSLSRDNNVFRFHSNLTNGSSMIRNAITYNGEKLISIDVKNSQPYLSIVLMSRKFWEMEKNASKMEEIIISQLFQDINYSKSYNYRHNKLILIEILASMDSYIMLGEIEESLLNKGFQRFINLVVKGELYEFLEGVFSKELGVKYSSRKEVKSGVFQVLFTDNRFIGQEAAKAKKEFKNIFPEVYQLFSIIKKKHKTVLPLLLQRIESYLIIDVIAKRISVEYPNAPIYPIHDSIATTKEFVVDIQRIMNEELTKAIGHPPVLQVEKWDIKNMDKYLNFLKQKAKVVA